MIYYCPLERYFERYTYQLSDVYPIGWMERSWRENSVSYKRVSGGSRGCEEIKKGKGVVLDAVRRHKHASAQITELLEYADTWNQHDDVIYFEDFWHPGIESLGYASEVMDKPFPRMYAQLWAQSVDRYDFTRSF